VRYFQHHAALLGKFSIAAYNINQRLNRKIAADEGSPWPNPTLPSPTLLAPPPYPPASCLNRPIKRKAQHSQRPLVNAGLDGSSFQRSTKAVDAFLKAVDAQPLEPATQSLIGNVGDDIATKLSAKGLTNEVDRI
jgi:hypothetical protein